MKQRYIYLAIGILQLISGISGGGLILWALLNTSIQLFDTLLLPLYLAYSLVFIIAGILIIRGRVSGVWLSVLAQLIAIPHYATTEINYGFNNIVHLFFQFSNGEKAMSIDIVASMLFFYLSLSVPISNFKEAIDDQN
ncbi:MAG: hypothetical protein MI976_03855 [Pseudomonadales bacterium]|nr:hypothetical protein [Pseudomonadales bacterium]